MDTTLQIILGVVIFMLTANILFSFSLIHKVSYMTILVERVRVQQRETESTLNQVYRMASRTEREAIATQAARDRALQRDVNRYLGRSLSDLPDMPSPSPSPPNQAPPEDQNIWDHIEDQD